MELLLGSGNSREKKIRPAWRPQTWTHLIALDMDPNCKADCLADIEDGLPFHDNTFDEVHAYEVLEHLGQQGDYRSFFQHFAELYRILKPYGILVGSTPKWDSVWAWSDPGHRRIVSPSSLVFLNQAEYARQIGVSPMTDYRWLWKNDFRLVWTQDQGDSYNWILQKHPETV
jgi:SAM-dependent methyltransferase